MQTIKLVKALNEGGHEVRVCCYHEHDPAIVARIEEAGAIVTILGLQRSQQRYRLRDVIAFVRKFRKALADLRPDIVHVQYLAPALLPILVARLCGVPRIFATVHIAGSAAYGPKAKVMLRVAARLCTTFFCVSQGVERFWFGDSKIYDPTERPVRRRHFTIYNGVDAGKIHGIIQNKNRTVEGLQSASPDGLVIGFVGRLTRQKGVTYLLEAMAEVLQAYPASMLVVAGDGPDRSALQEEALRLGIQERVLWRGALPFEEICQLLGCIDVLVMPSLWEGFGLSAAEAMAAGCPVIASRIEGLEEVVEDGVTGILVPPAAPKVLVEAIKLMLGSPSLRNRMGEMGRRRVRERFSIEVQNKAWLSIHKA
jgi:glycosyltransferase involved in cell wall biosynthesis